MPFVRCQLKFHLAIPGPWRAIAGHRYPGGRPGRPPPGLPDGAALRCGRGAPTHWGGVFSVLDPIVAG
ncbi:MAG TPA: hypothetical protein VIP48_00880, partial [Streptosporangiaceae bacterium]